MISAEQVAKLSNLNISTIHLRPLAVNKIPTRFLQGLNIVVYGIDFKGMCLETCKVDIDLDQKFLGKLSKQSDELKNQVYRSADMVGWDYTLHNDPELVLFQPIEKIKIISNN